MNFKEMFKHKWHVWFNHGMGQTDVYAPTLEEAKKNALAWCRKQKVLLERAKLDDMIYKVEETA